MCNASIEVGIPDSSDQVCLVSPRHEIMTYVENMRNGKVIADIVEHRRPSWSATNSLPNIFVGYDWNIRDGGLFRANVGRTNYQERFAFFFGGSI
jgi:hypothetical protein